MRRAFLPLLILVLTWSSAPAMNAGSPEPDTPQRKQKADDSSTESKARRLLPGAVVELRLENGEKLRGRVVGLIEDQLVVQWVNRGSIENRKIGLGEVKAVKVLRTKPSTAKTVAQYVFVGALGGAVGAGELAKEKKR